MIRTPTLAGIFLFLPVCLLGRKWHDRSAGIASSVQELRQLASTVQAG